MAGRANRLYLNQLYLNRQGLRGNPLQFVDTAVSAGVAYTRDAVQMQNDRHSGPTFADLDGDGDLDLFVGGLFGDPNKIYQNLNDGSCQFADITAQSPEIVAMEALTTISAAFGDYDLDGDLDMFLSHWGTRDENYSAHPVWTTEHLWKNLHSETGTISFVNVSVESGVSDITRSTRDLPGPTGQQQDTDFTFTPSFALIDGDEWPDIVIAGDFGTSQLLLNNGDGTFRDSSRDLLHGVNYGMGSSLGDFDNDGDLDWFVTAIAGAAPELTGNRLFENQLADTGVFALADITIPAGVIGGSWGWASCFVDIDNDKDLDIYQTNGWPYEFLDVFFTADVTPVFIQDGGTFVDRAAMLGLNDDYSARGAVCADFDEDGDVDILQLTDRSTNAGVLWENRSAASGQNYLRVRLQGLAPNTEAAGARIYVTVDGVTQMREIGIGSNYISQNPAVQNFGLGTANLVEQIRIVWPARVPPGGGAPIQAADTVLPDGAMPAITANQTLVISQPP